MTTLFLDTEFNGFGGELISIALVSDAGDEFYVVVEHGHLCEFARTHVLPVLGAEPVCREDAGMRMSEWLNDVQRRDRGAMRIIADWPEDIVHFMELLLIEPGRAFNVPPIDVHLYNQPMATASAVPHNALEDARAMVKLWTATLKPRS